MILRKLGHRTIYLYNHGWRWRWKTPCLTFPSSSSSSYSFFSSSTSIFHKTRSTRIPNLCCGKRSIHTNSNTNAHRKWKWTCSNDLFHNNSSIIQFKNSNSNPNLRFISNFGKETDLSLAWKSASKVYNKGPDQILPSQARYSWHPEGAVQIVLGNTPASQITPKSVPEYMKEAVNDAPNTVALRIKRNNEWSTWTFSQYHDEIWTVAKAFIALGLERHHAACILGNNNPEWFISNFAAIFAGGLSTGIYATNNPKAVAHCAIDSRANIFVVEDRNQLDKVLQIRKELPDLRAIIVMDDTSCPKMNSIMTWKQLIQLGKEKPDSILEDRLRLIAINQCCTLIYTSGTTGTPKGVMLSHDNLTWTTESVGRSLEFFPTEQRMISFLPLSHIAAQISDMYCQLLLRATVTFGDKDVMKGSIMNTVKETKPTYFFTVPRLFEKIYERMLEMRETAGPFQRILVDVAKSRGLKYNLMLSNGIKSPKVLGFHLFDKLVFSRLRKEMGLDECQMILSGAAPLDIEILKSFLSLNMPIFELFGLSETTGPMTGNTTKHFRLGSVGKSLPGLEITIIDPNETGHGEIAVKGRSVMMGYLNQPEKTASTFSKDFCLFTGDIGFIDPDGFVFITGREKEIIITKGGENVPPFEIESRVKASLAIASNAVLVGDQKKCLTLLMTLKTVPDANGEPTDMLTEFVVTWIAHHGEMNCKTVSDVLPAVQLNSDHKLRQAIQNRIDRVNNSATSHAQRIQNWVILPRDFSQTGGEIGPTLKLKRNIVNVKYSKDIEAMYESIKAHPHQNQKSNIHE